MKVFLNQLFDYNFYCNKRLIEECQKLGSVPDKSQTLFSHILNAHHLWNARIMQKPATYKVWQEQDVADWGELHYENQRTSFEIITNTDNLEQRIDYVNTEGRAYTNTIRDILFHIINHSTNHRAQIAVDFRNNDLEPLVLDYIFYKR
ncbi:DinB family protein [Zeaxanthinibacter sp. PT1]|uniref:DinB family protein n=1 Tax=Zeaxanthinibacter TaxID=561554 RepID=UPI00234A267D|nr:DinB family protein [Zeaxanthinibacter sp. PT1]MDC6350415.1 DinB family protein [Zeaxanthinibacter sp. PT1]